jgi:Pyruvate/2-oxoacid:ferredoxin oxidoreductase gamma subunit
VNKSIRIVIAALGGEGGGVLGKWIADMAARAGYHTQTTSVPGVAQRTGATIYYIEIFPRTETGDAPVMSMFPTPGDVDIVICSEIVEAGRMIQRGFVTPDRTTLITSTHRVYGISEKEAMGNGVRFSWVTFDEDYGKVPQFWFALNILGQRGIGEVPKNFLCWPTYPSCRSLQGPHASKRVDNVCRHSPVFRSQAWRRVTIKQTTRGPAVWEIKAARVHLVDTTGSASVPTDRKYWLIVARNPATDEVKYFVSNAPASMSLQEMMATAFARWHIEKWFERAKQEAGFGAFEVRTYKSLIRHWLCARMAMYFLAEQTQRLRGEKSADHAGAGSGRGEPLDRESMDARMACVA